MIRVKDKEGNLAWQSDQELVQDSMNGDAAFGQAGLPSWLRMDSCRLVARVSAFQDLWTSVYNRSLAVHHRSGGAVGMIPTAFPG